MTDQTLLAARIARINERMQALRRRIDTKVAVGDYAGAAHNWSQVEALVWVLELLEKA